MSEGSEATELSPTEVLLQGLGAKPVEAPAEDQVEIPEGLVNSQAEESDAQVEEEAKAPDFHQQLEAAGLNPESFYSTTVPGTEHTFSEAKDALEELDGLDMRKAQLESGLRDRENDIIAKLRDASALIEQIPAEYRTEDVLKGLASQQELRVARERQLMLDTMPEWADETKRHTEQQQVIGLGRDYGMTDAELGNLADHRIVRMMRDYAGLKALLKSADGKKTQAKTRRNPANRRAPDKSGLQQIAADEKAGKITAQEASTLTLLTGLRK